jgi:hypothetical protein
MQNPSWNRPCVTKIANSPGVFQCPPKDFYQYVIEQHKLTGKILLLVLGYAIRIVVRNDTFFARITLFLVRCGGNKKLK